MIEIINKKKISDKKDIKVGQIYARFDNKNSLYIVSRLVLDDDEVCFALINLSTGRNYDRLEENIDDIFSSFKDSFYLVEDVTIIVE